MFSIRNATPLIALVVSISAAHAANETVLHTFEYDISGADPIAGLLRDSTGNLYGTTSLGGAFNKGTVFKIDTSGAETVLLNFQGPNGSFPVAALVSDSSGNLYGTTVSGGASDNGVVFKLDASGKETLLHSFAGAPDGASPEGGVVLDPQGNLYGATYYGGSSNAGVIYKVDTSGNETVLYTFTSVRDDGYPLGNLIIDSRGNLYGTASGGYGAVYELEKSGTLRVLHQFTYSLDGEQPRAGLTADSAGNLYGTTFLGGSGGSNGCDYDECGTVFKIDTSGQETIIHNFTGVNDGSNPAGPLILDSQGNLRDYHHGRHLLRRHSLRDLRFRCGNRAL